MNQNASESSLPIPPEPSALDAAPRGKLWPLVLLCAVYVIVDEWFAHGKLASENAEQQQFFALAFVLPQLSLWLAWFMLSKRRLGVRFAVSACLALVCLRFSPGDRWLMEFFYRLMNSRWHVLICTQLALIGAALFVAQRHGLLPSATGTPRRITLFGGKPRSFAADLWGAFAILAICLEVAKNFLLQPYMGFPWGLASIGAAFAVDAFLVLWSVLVADCKSGRVLAWLLCAWLLALCLNAVLLDAALSNSLFLDLNSTTRVFLTASTHLGVLLAAVGIARLSGYRPEPTSPVAVGSAGQIASLSLAEVMGWMIAVFWVALLAALAYLLQREYLRVHPHLFATGAIIEFVVLTLLVSWVWLAPGPMLARAMIFGLSIYWQQEALRHRAEPYLILALAWSAPLLYLRRGKIRLALGPRSQPRDAIARLPPVRLSDYFLIIALVGVTMAIVGHNVPADIAIDRYIGIGIIAFTFALVALAALRIEFGATRSYQWHGIRLATPMGAALLMTLFLETQGIPVSVHERILNFAIPLYAYTLLLSGALILLRVVGFRLVVVGAQPDHNVGSPDAQVAAETAQRDLAGSSTRPNG
jgi:hypothetical protein